MKQRQPLKLNAFNCNLFETQEFTINGYKMIMVNDLDYDFVTFCYKFDSIWKNEFYLSCYYYYNGKKPRVDVFFDFRHPQTTPSIDMQDVEIQLKIDLLSKDQDITNDLLKGMSRFVKTVNKKLNCNMKETL